MSVAFYRSGFIRKVVSAVCLLTFPAVAQQSSTIAPPQPTGGGADASIALSQQQNPPGAPLPNAPQPQQLPQPTHVDYSKSVPLFPNPFARYIPRDVAPPIFTNSPRIAGTVQNGKFMLSLNDALAIALVDNLDIAVARYNLPLADTDILRTKGGGAFQGGNFGLVQNTPGGTGATPAGVTGAGAGGTTAGAGGVGTGTGGIVGSTLGLGPGVPAYDPVLSGTLQFQRLVVQQSNAVTSGTTVADTNTTTGNLSYTQGYSPGTSLSVGLQNNRISSNSVRNFINPTLNSAFAATVTQHLLQGFGPSLNKRLIHIAKNNKRISEEAFRNQVISTVSQIENIYWDLVNAYEDFKVKERSLALAQKILSDNQKQVTIGTLAPLDVTRAKSNVATALQDLIVSKTNLQLQQLFMKNALTRTLPNNSQVMQMEIIPTDTVQIPDQENLPPVEELITTALASRPDYNQQKIGLQNSAINLKGTSNGLLPVVDIFGFYGGSGLAGVQNPLFPQCVGGVTPPNCLFPGSIATTGFGDAFTNAFNGTSPNKGMGFNIQIPLGNRVAEAIQARSKIEYRQSQLGLRALENQIAILVRQDAYTVEQDKARVAAAQEARELAAQVLDAEQKKYTLGASTYVAVLQDERDLTAAESNLVTAKTQYAKAKVQLDKDTAQTLDHNNIKIDEAVTGEIKTEPNVPGIMPNKNALQDLSPAPPAKP